MYKDDVGSICFRMWICELFHGFILMFTAAAVAFS